MKQNPRRILQGLTVVTVAALAGIVALQAYWLWTSYTDQRNRFNADVENAMVATMVKQSFTGPLMGGASDKFSIIFNEGLGDVLATISSKLPRDMKKLSNLHINIGDTTGLGHLTDSVGAALSPASNNADSAFAAFAKNLAENMKKAPKPSMLQMLAGARKRLTMELNRRGIYTPFEIALLDSNNHFVTATTDTARFAGIPVKSALSSYDINDAMAGYQFQSAFPDANLHLLRRMGWTLSVTALLILLCAVSFTLLLRLFFRQKRLSDIRSDFLNNMTHELKTPIASVSVALELMQDTRRSVPEAARQEYLSIAQGELKRLTMLVEKVLKMAAFEKSEIRIAPESFLATSWLADVVASLRPVLEAADAQLTTRVQPELLLLWADRTHLTNVLQNLLENALKYTDKPVPQVEVRIYQENGMATLEVSDNGKGIPAAYVDRVFDKFFRVPTGDRHDTKGYGLGLSYVKAVAELHGGTVRVVSTPGAGSAFFVRLPVKPGA